jgi:chaperonin GroES
LAYDTNEITVQFGGSPVKVGEEEYTLFRDSEILAKINE